MSQSIATLANLAKHRMEQQRLTGTPYARPEDVVEGMLAMQSQDYLGAKWAVAQRTRSADDAAVQEAFQDGRILRTHVMRPTWHFVAPADIRWLVALTAPRVHAQNAYYYRMHGLDAARVKRSNARIAKALARGTHLTRDELAEVLGGNNSAVSGNRLAYSCALNSTDSSAAAPCAEGNTPTPCWRNGSHPRRC